MPSTSPAPRRFSRARRVAEGVGAVAAESPAGVNPDEIPPANVPTAMAGCQCDRGSRRENPLQQLNARGTIPSMLLGHDPAV